MVNSLSPKRKRFVDEYLFDLNATKAADRAGYKHPNVQGSQLLAMPVIKAIVSTNIERRCEGARVDADWVLQHLEKEALNPKNAASVRVKALELLGRHLDIFSSGSEQKVNQESFCFADIGEL